MAKTQGERLELLERQVAELERTFAVERATSALQNGHDQEIVKGIQSTVKELQAAEIPRAAAEAKLDQRCTALEKTADRGFSFVQAAIISVISMIGGALLSLLVQLAIKK